MAKSIQDIIAQIQKLRNLANNNSNSEEAAAAYGAAQRLIAMHQIAEAEIEAQKPSPVEVPINAKGKAVYETSRIVPWKERLVRGLANLQGCYCIDWQETNDKGRILHLYRVIGANDDIEIVEYLFGAIVVKIGELADMYAPQIGRGVSTERLNFCLGATQGILTRMQQEQRAAYQTASSAAMVLLSNKGDRAKLAFADANPRARITTSSRQSKMQSNETARRLGFEFGQQIQVSPGMKAGGETEMKKLK